MDRLSCIICLARMPIILIDHLSGPRSFRGHSTSSTSPSALTSVLQRGQVSSVSRVGLQGFKGRRINFLSSAIYRPKRQKPHRASEHTKAAQTNHRKWGTIPMTTGTFYAPPSEFVSGPRAQGKVDGTSYTVHSIAKTSVVCVILQIRDTQSFSIRRTWDRDRPTTPLLEGLGGFT